MSGLTEIERLGLIEEIKVMRARFARLLDTKDWDGLAKLWANDSTLDASVDGGGSDIRAGRAAIMEFIRQTLDGAVTIHHVFAPEITLISAVHATGIWAMEDRLRWASGGPCRYLHGFGHYNEEYQKTDGSWRIQDFRLTRLHVDVEQ